MHPEHVLSMRWAQAQTIARQTCGRIFQTGGAPHDALALHGLGVDDRDELDWPRAVDLISHALATTDRTAHDQRQGRMAA